MTRYIHLIAKWMQGITGFLVVQGFWAASIFLGFLFHWPDQYVLALTLVLSVLAIAMSSVILVAGRTSEEAIQVKLDTLVAAIPEADNAVIGLEHKEA